MANGIPPEACYILGKRRLLSLDADKAVYERAWNIAAYLRAGTRGVRPTAYPHEATFGLMHAIAPKLRIHMEINALVEELGVECIYISSERLFDAFCLCGFLNNGFGETSPPSGNPTRKPARDAATSRSGAISLAFVDAEARERPFLQKAVDQLKHELSAVFRHETIRLAPIRFGQKTRLLGLMRMMHLYRRLRKGGHSKSVALSIALSAASYEGGMLAYLNDIAASFRKRAIAEPQAVAVATNIARLPVLFAIAGARSGGGRTAAIETMLITQRRRYPTFEPDDRFVIDEGQSTLIKSTGTNARVHACGSVLVEARSRELGREPSVSPRVVIASQPSDRDMRRIMALCSELPAPAEIRISAHAEDQAAFRAWLAGMGGRFKNPDVRLDEGGVDPLKTATVVITATSNIAVLAQALSIPSILVAARRDLEDIWLDGPYPGLWVDPERDDAQVLFLQAYQRALSGDLGEYRKINEDHLRPGVAARIATVFDHQRD
ncbi:hypothetical protein DFR48_1084 [Ciceribacter lividus]|uniref:Uncharacterized protein n=1 Tax=Ciceribacter lividus TaxID=1197950 RepID=A0A6I7HKT3_9HYPH|nr:hypothetical protein [Ciceribacter lividus]RCW22482.1 hypothetical protein DFR48_1084 [Ciceribacter lividus]